MSRVARLGSSHRMAIELVEADCEIVFGLVDIAELESSSGDRKLAVRALDDADNVVLDIEERLVRLAERNRAPFEPLVSELRRQITQARSHIPGPT